MVVFPLKQPWSNMAYFDSLSNITFALSVRLEWSCVIRGVMTWGYIEYNCEG